MRGFRYTCSGTACVEASTNISPVQVEELKVRKAVPTIWCSRCASAVAGNGGPDSMLHAFAVQDFAGDHSCLCTL